jgi:hypothetical protein
LEALNVSPDLAGLAALLALLLLPGLLIVRSPWVYVPFLSVAFWLLTWWWLPLLGKGRLGFLQVTLALFAALAGLRLFKPIVLKRPAWPSLLVLGAALARLLPFRLWPVAPGTEVHSLTAQLLVWRDGLPLSYEPILPFRLTSADVSGLAALAADVSLLSGLSAARSVLLVAAASCGLLQVGLFAFLARAFPRKIAALGAVVCVGLLPEGLPLDALPLALLLSAFSLWVGGEGRARAVAAGAFLGAAFVGGPSLVVAGSLFLPLLLGVFRSRGAPRLWVLALALSLAAPSLARLGRIFPDATVAHRSFLLVLGLGLAGVLVGRTRRAALLGAAVTALGTGAVVLWGGIGGSLLVVALSTGIASLVEALWMRERAVSRAAVLALLALAAEGTSRSSLEAASAIAVTRDDLDAAAWIQAHTTFLEVICTQDRAGLWIPALAGRAIEPPLVPRLHEGEPRPEQRCALRYASKRGALDQPSPPSLVFSNPSVSIFAVDSSHRFTTPGGT